MFKSTRGSVTMMAYAAMLFFALYGVILFSNAAREYKTQTNAINTVIESYNQDTTTENLIKLYYENGGKNI